MFSTDILTKLRAIVIATVLVLVASSPAYARQMGPAPPEFLVTTPSNYDFSDTVDLLKGAIEQQNLMVINEIDAQKMLRMVEMKSGGMKQIQFFHPRYMKAIIEKNRNGSIVPPMKIVVMEMPNGKVMVRYDRPTHMFESYEGLGDIASELEEITAAVVSEIKN
jgi:uncharacterized protein (DUF302 family)